MDLDMGLVEALRWTNAVFGTALLAWLVVRSFIRWEDYSYVVRLVLLTLMFYVFGIAFASAEMALQNDRPPGGRSFIYLVANISLLATLIFTQPRPKPARRH